MYTKAYGAVRRERDRNKADAAGLCRVCLKEKRVAGRVKCFGCLKKMREASASLRERLVGDRKCIECKKRPAAKGIKRCESCRSQANARTKQWRTALRLELMTHYSFGTPICRCCGQTHPVYLTIDHIDDDGGEHRKRELGSNKGNGLNSFYLKIKLGGYVERLQVLCWNCQWAKRLNDGVCPIRGTDMTIPPTREEVDALRSG